jgi:type II secretory pathway pseudopilin PulG
MIFNDMKRIISMKNKLCKNRRSGFTLVEIIVTLVITIIIIGVSSSILISTTGIFGRTALRDMQQSVAETVLNFATDRTLYAVDLKLTDSAGALDAAKTGNAVLGIDGKGQLVYIRSGDKDTWPPINVFGDNFYSKYRVSLTYSVIKPDGEGFSIVMNAELTDERNEKVVLNRTMTRPLLNYKGEITGPVIITKDSANGYIIIS